MSLDIHDDEGLTHSVVAAYGRGFAFVCNALGKHAIPFEAEPAVGGLYVISVHPKHKEFMDMALRGWLAQPSI